MELTTEANKAIVRRLIDEVMNAGRFEVAITATLNTVVDRPRLPNGHGSRPARGPPYREE